MKKKNVLKSLTLFTIVMFFICAFTFNSTAQVADEAIYDVKELAKKAIKEGKVEIIDCKMEKITNKDGEHVIKITGTAKYIPAKFGKKQLKDNPVFTGFKAYFYNTNGMKLKGNQALSEYGENNQPENVEYKKPFPFIIEGTAGGYFPEGTWENADYCVVRGWNTAEKVSSKDSK